MTDTSTNRMVEIDAEIDQAVAQDGWGSERVGALLTEYEALLARWLAEVRERFKEGRNGA